MPPPISTLWLSREDRRERARQNGKTAAASTATTRACLFCHGPLTNGAAVCGEACDEGYWRLVPTVDGELYGVTLPEPEEPPQRRAMTPAERQRKRREKIRAQRAMLAP